MKILLINGSPKRDKSDTLKMTRAFLDGMNEYERQEISEITVVDKNIGFCKGCFACKLNGGDCVINDDMKGIIEDFLSSDLLLFSFPLHSFGFPAPLKNLIDRCLPMSAMAMQKVGDRYEHVAQRDYSALKYLMICGCGFPNAKRNFEPVIEQFKLCFPNNHTIIAVPESPMFSVPEANSITSPRLELIKMAGREYAETGKITPELLDEICSPMIPEEVYAKICNGGK